MSKRWCRSAPTKVKAPQKVPPSSATTATTVITQRRHGTAIIVPTIEPLVTAGRATAGWVRMTPNSAAPAAT